MPHGGTNHPLASVIEVYAILIKRLTDSIYGLFTALGCLLLNITVIAVFPIVCVSATFYIIVTSLIEVDPRQEVDSHNLRIVAEVQRGLPDEATVVTVDKSLADIPNGSLADIIAMKINGHLHVLPTELPPAIPPYLKDREVFYNKVDMKFHENSKLLLVGRGQMVRLTICGRRISSGPGCVKMVLENYDRMSVSSESERGVLELWNRVYVGPAEWLVRVLEEFA